MIGLVPYDDSTDSDSEPDNPRPDTQQAQVRVRSFPHVEGNYPAHVYIPVPAAKHVRKDLHSFFSQMKAKLDGLNPVVDSVGNKRGSREAPPPDVQDGYHLSLSRTVPVTFDQIDSLVGALHRQLAATLSFTIKMAGPRVFINDQRTRTFLALGLQCGAEQACGVIGKVDAAFQGLGLPPFHQVPDPHVSIAWMLGDAVGAMEAAVQQLAHEAAAQQAVVAGGSGQQLAQGGSGQSCAVSTSDRTLGSGVAEAGQQGASEVVGAMGGAEAVAAQSPVWACKVHRVMCRVGQRDHVVWSAGGL